MPAFSLSAGACLHVVKPNIEIAEVQSCTDLETIGSNLQAKSLVLKPWVRRPGTLFAILRCQMQDGVKVAARRWCALCF
jgi:hypothetical protein